MTMEGAEKIADKIGEATYKTASKRELVGVASKALLKNALTEGA